MALNNILKKFFLDENKILLLIILNAIVIFISGFFYDKSICRVISLVDNIITVLFVIELSVKLNTYGKTYFCSYWNILDFVLIVISIPTLIIYILSIEFTDFSFLLIFRVLRVFKSFRVLKFIPGINELIAGINRALKASIVVMLGFFVYIFIIGILSFFLFNESANEYFQNPLISLYSTFKLFTIEGWFEIPECITNGSSAISSFFTYLYFVFVVLSGGIIGLSLVNSVFVDAMVSDNNDELIKKIDNLEKKINLLIEEKQNK